MRIVNEFLCILLLAGLIFEVYLILGRNRRIRIVGKEDLIFSLIPLLAVVLLLPLSANADYVEQIRNILLLALLLGSLGIRRGLSERGVEKICYTVPWKSIQKAEIESGANNQIIARFEGEGKKTKLLFSRYKLQELLGNLEGTGVQILLREDLAQSLEKKS